MQTLFSISVFFFFFFQCLCVFVSYIEPFVVHWTLMLFGLINRLHWFFGRLKTLNTRKKRCSGDNNKIHSLGQRIFMIYSGFHSFPHIFLLFFLHILVSLKLWDTDKSLKSKKEISSIWHYWLYELARRHFPSVFLFSCSISATDVTQYNPLTLPSIDGMLHVHWAWAFMIYWIE